MIATANEIEIIQSYNRAKSLYDHDKIKAKISSLRDALTLCLLKFGVSDNCGIIL